MGKDTKTTNETVNTDTKTEQQEEYHDIFWYALQSIKENMMQTTWTPPSDAPAGCQGGCANCGFHCAHAGVSAVKSEYDKPDTNDPYGERHHVDLSKAPAPETTFPMVQIVAALVACIVGCYLANQFFMNVLA